MSEPGSPLSSNASPPAAELVALLADFRAKAGPIVAQARGLTPAARLKLADVARQVGIPEDQFEGALRSLHAPAPGKPANKQAEKFRRRLLVDLQAKEGTILGPTHETRILAAAREKYGLDDATALEMLARATGELGIQRVRGDEATRNLTDAIQDALGDHTWLAEEVRNRLHAAGKQWGLGPETVDRFIEEQLDANRALAARSVKLSRAIYVLVGALALAVVVALWALLSRTAPSPGPLAEADHPLQHDSPADSAGPPKWWSARQALAMEQARKSLDHFSDVAPHLASADAKRRAAGYAQLVALVEHAAPSAEHLQIVGDLVKQAYAAEPDDAAAAALRGKLLSHLPTADSPLPKHQAAYDLAFWAAETAVAAASEPKLAPERRAPLVDELSLRTGARIDPALTPGQQTEAVLAGLSRVVLRQFVSQAPTSPESVAAFHSAIRERAAAYLDKPELQRLQCELLRGALTADQVEPVETSASPDPASLRALLLELAGSSDPQVTLALVDLYERMSPSPLRDELQSLLLLRLNVRTVPQSPRAIARALRRALGVAPSGSQAVQQRWELLRSRAEEALDRPGAAGNVGQQLTAAAECAWLATEALALAQGEAGVPIYDELAELYPEEPFALKLPETAETALPPPAVSGVLVAAEQQAFTRMLGYLTSSDTNQIQHESALRGLVTLAPRLEDLRPLHARQLAAYLLKNKPDSEHATAVAAVGTLRRWKQLRLAVADAIPSAALRAEQQAELVEALAGLPLLDADPTAWPRFLLASVISDLPAGEVAGGVPREQRQTLEAAAESLQNTYRVRARLLGVSPADYQAATLPSQVLEACARQMIPQVATLPPRGSLAATAEFTGWPVAVVDRWQKELTAVDYLASDDLARTVLLNELLLKLSLASLLHEREEQTEPALQLLQQSRARQREAKSAPEQLRQIEADLLRTWLLLAPREG